MVQTHGHEGVERGAGPVVGLWAGKDHPNGATVKSLPRQELLSRQAKPLGQ